MQISRDLMALCRMSSHMNCKSDTPGALIVVTVDFPALVLVKYSGVQTWTRSTDGFN